MATLFVPISLHVSPVLQDRHALALGWQHLLATALLGSTVQLAAHPSLPVQTYALQDPTVLLDQQALYPARLARSVLVRDLVYHLVYAVPDTTALAVPPPSHDRDIATHLATHYERRHVVALQS